jgi:hypothetical protein
MSYGMPSIGILCTQLLNQVKNPAVEIKLPHSEIVQNLSLMIGFLDWIAPTSNSVSNGNLCRQMSRVIRRVLDQLFDAPSVEENEGRGVEQPVDIPDGLWSIDEQEDLDWLCSIDWSSGQLVEFCQV